MPEPHILLSVEAGTDCGTPPLIAAWRPGAWPRPAESTQPITTSSTSPPSMPARDRVSRIAAAPSVTAVSFFNSPWKLPMGVRAAAAMTIGSLDEIMTNSS